MIIAHLSDLHQSLLGRAMTEGFRPPPIRTDLDKWTTERTSVGFQLQHQAGRFRVLDSLNRQLMTTQDHAQAVTSFTTAARLSAPGLCADWPDREQLSTLANAHHDHLGIRLALLVEQLADDDPDVILITGDLTDDGVGYRLIEKAFARWIDSGDLYIVPGNHDIYPSPPVVVPRNQRRSMQDKRATWAAFCERIGRPTPDAYVADLGQGVALGLLDSAHPPRVLPTASGAVKPSDLHQLAARFGELAPAVKLVGVHHHVVNPPRKGIGLSPPQAGLRMRNGKDVLQRLTALGVDAIFSGHRHLGYIHRPATGPWLISSPSTTRGCHSGTKPYYWRVEVSADGVRSVDSVPVKALA